MRSRAPDPRPGSAGPRLRRPWPRLADRLLRHSGVVLVGFALTTVALVFPLILQEPTEDASQEPDATVLDLRDEFEARLDPVVHRDLFIVESRDADVLTQPVLSELLRNERALFVADAEGRLTPPGLPEQPYLLELFNTDADTRFTGLFTIADAVDQRLRRDPRFRIPLEEATDLHVKQALHALLADPLTAQLRDQFSGDLRARSEVVDGAEITIWSARAFAFWVSADNARLGGGSSRGTISGDDRIVDKENFSRNVQRILRGDEDTYRLWGVAIDQQRTAEEQGQTAGVFIMLTIVAAVAVVGIALRSYWATALTGVGLGALMIWLGGLSNLVGLKGGLIIELIVPIAIIALGVDFAVHALHRYQEERRPGVSDHDALRIGLGAVGGALVLAAVSDGIAFLANAAAGIEAVVHFGIAAALASGASFLLLGIAVPLAHVRIDQAAPRSPGGSRSSGALRLLGSVIAAVLAGAVVIITVAVSAALGAALLVLSVVLTIALPLSIVRRRARHQPANTPAPDAPPPLRDMAPDMAPEMAPDVTADVTVEATAGGALLGRIVASVADRRRVVLPAAAAITIVAVALAVRLDATFDVQDFFNRSSDFVVSIDTLDERFADTLGETSTIVIEGELAQPAALAAIDDLVSRLEGNRTLGHRRDGDLDFAEPNLLSILRRVMDAAQTRDRIRDVSGVSLRDDDANGLPDTGPQIAAVLDYAVREGVVTPDGRLIHSAVEVRAVLEHEPGGSVQYTALFVTVPGSSQQETVDDARRALDADLAPLAGAPGIDRVGLTGSPFERAEALDATTDAIFASLPIAAAGALVILLIAFRSVRYALVTVIPLGLVAAWLYALMFVAGFGLNFVTATIGAIAIGVGLDYAIHLTVRFREELARSGPAGAGVPRDALIAASNGSGVALFASAASTIAGFTIMAFAPMPLVASSGVLMAVMIALVLIASLLVLPSLLLLVTPACGAPGVDPGGAAGTSGIRGDQRGG